MSVDIREQLEFLSERCRAARTLQELAFSLVNDTYSLLGFRQALVFSEDSGTEPLAVSGLTRPEGDSPYLLWLRELWSWLRPQLVSSPCWYEPESMASLPTESLREGWTEWWPQGVLALSLGRRDGEPLAWVLFLVEAPPSAAIMEALQRQSDVWAYSWEMLAGPSTKSLRARWRVMPRLLRLAIVFAAGLVLLLPVRESALAPAEVVSLDARLVASPLDGVVRDVHVRPNQPVKAGDLLFSLDGTTLRNRLEVARKSVQVADAEWLAATQKAFDQSQSRAELAQLRGRAQERRAELAAIQAQLARLAVTAPHDGVAVFADANDWLGRPVATGERIMFLADPAKPGMLVHLPVSDAVALEPGSEVRLYLTVRPLAPLAGTIFETSYQAAPSPDGVASYRLRARFADTVPLDELRLGLRGTAKVQGGRVLLGYYLFRRPIAALREWSGW